MIAPDLETAIERLQELVEAARVIVPFTGAGISTECGIPDFRSPGGLWTKNQPIPFDEFVASQDMRDEAWRRRFAMDEQFRRRAARPRAPRARQPLPRRQGARRDHAEHRQPASKFGHCSRTRDRAARQYHLCHLPRLRQALRTRVGREQFEQSGGARPNAPAAAATSRPRRSPSVRRCRSATMRRAES